jgi:hypothetical protein
LAFEVTDQVDVIQKRLMDTCGLDCHVTNTINLETLIEDAQCVRVRPPSLVVDALPVQEGEVLEEDIGDVSPERMFPQSVTQSISREDVEESVVESPSLRGRAQESADEPLVPADRVVQEVNHTQVNDSFILFFTMSNSLSNSRDWLCANVSRVSISLMFRWLYLQRKPLSVNASRLWNRWKINHGQNQLKKSPWSPSNQKLGISHRWKISRARNQRKENPWWLNLWLKFQPKLCLNHLWKQPHPLEQLLELKLNRKPKRASSLKVHLSRNRRHKRARPLLKGCHRRQRRYHCNVDSCFWFDLILKETELFTGQSDVEMESLTQQVQETESSVVPEEVGVLVLLFLFILVLIFCFPLSLRSKRVNRWNQPVEKWPKKRNRKLPRYEPHRVAILVRHPSNRLRISFPGKSRDGNDCCVADATIGSLF